MRKPRLQIGHFDLLEPVGRGGMGVVWKGVHREQNVPVAVKLIGQTSTDASRSFRNEVRAMAGLDHPNVVYVYDVGDVSVEAARAAQGRFVAGSPYIAMEFASRGSLYELGRLNWQELKAVLISLLDALAHAHARGVIHRDLKPGNVLVCGSDDLRPGLKLADFGIAHALEKTEMVTMSHKGAVGTLNYMAPEQIRAETADYGPWTDLYALGNVAWNLATGKVPFKRYQGVALIRAQLEEPLPDLKQQLPEGFQEWLNKLLQKEPKDRFRRAADAAQALAELEDLPPAVEATFKSTKMDHALRETLLGSTPTAVLQQGALQRSEVDPFEDDPTFVDDLNETQAMERPARKRQRGAPSLVNFKPQSKKRLDGSGRRLADPLAESHQGLGLDKLLAAMPEAGGERTLRVPQALLRELDILKKGASTENAIPDDWRRPPKPRPIQLLGAGLALWGVRSLPIVGRFEERDGLWDALQQVSETQTAHMVVISGVAGTGKSRLAEWLCERSHEVGATSVLQTAFESGKDGIQELWVRHTRARRMKDSERRKHIGKVARSLGLSGGAARFGTLMDGGDLDTRLALSRQMIEAICEERPVVLWLDDVHNSVEGLRLADLILNPPDGHSMPVLILATVRDDLVLDSPDVRLLLNELREMDRVANLRVEPLKARGRVRLVEELLSLSPTLAAQVVERTGGNPAFAVQLVGEWIARGAFIPGPTGFDVKPGTLTELPASMQSIWTDRLERLLDGMDERALAVLEMAAVLGMEVDEEEWQRVNDDPEGGWAAVGRVHFVPAHAKLRVLLTDRLIKTRMAEETPAGWRFSDAMFRQSLLEQARTKGRLADHHRAAARMLEFTDRDEETVAERFGQHLLLAGELEEAVGPLLDGVRRRRNTVGYKPALGLLGQLEEALQTLNLDRSDSRWAEVWNLRAELYNELGELDEAARWAERVIEEAQHFSDWDVHAISATLKLGMVAVYRGQLQDADDLLAEVERRAHDPEVKGLAVAHRAVVAGRLGDTDAARGHTTNAVRLMRRAGSSKALADCWRLVGGTAFVEGQHRQAESALARSLRLYERQGHLYGQAECLSQLGEVAFARGDGELAKERYDRSIELYELTGSSQVVFPKLGLAKVLLEQRSWPVAHGVLTTIKASLERQQRASLVEDLPFLQLLASAGVGEWKEFDVHLRRASKPSNTYSRKVVERAIRLAAKAGKSRRAKEAHSLLS